LSSHSLITLGSRVRGGSVLALLAFLLVSGTAIAQNTLPPCAGKNTSSWNGCVGTLTSGKSILYTGEFVNGKKQGYGEETIPHTNGNDRYVGQFHEGRRHGKGIFYFSNGGKYEGELVRGQFNGDGSFESPNGDRYVGQFRNGQFAGEGVYTFANGNVVQEGVFENGVFVRAAKIQQRTTMPDTAGQFNEASRLNPGAIKAMPERDAVAIIIGIQSYKNLPPARFANSDARLFSEYAQRLLGVRSDKIRLLTDGDAGEIDIARAFRSWLMRNVNKGKTDVYIFYSGHGLPSDDGKSLYLLPHNVDRDFIDKTAINQTELISLTEATGAKTVTMFIDSCYSGQTRNGDALLANARPVALKSKSTGYPSTFTVLTASAPDQISWSSDELGHGIFSYYLMKGMEGGADGNQDGKLTAGELHAYLLDKVNRQAAIQNKKQQPQLVGDPDQIVISR
jgi:hypothetical protein